MDFRDLLLEADRNQKEKENAKQSKNKNRHSSNMPAAKEQKKSSGQRSEAIQKLLDEKENEERQKREAQERERRRKEKAREEKEREEKQKNTFRIPKKATPKDPASDAESFSSISSGDEAKMSDMTSDKQSAHHHKSHKSSSHGSDHKSSSSRHSHGEKSHISSSHKDSENDKKSSSKHSHSSKSHKLSSHEHSDKKDKHSHSSKGLHHSDTDNNRHHSDKHHHSEKEKSKLHSDNHKHSSDNHKHSSSEKTDSGSSKTHHGTSKRDRSHSEKDKSHSEKDKSHSEKDKSHNGSVSNSKSSKEKPHKHHHHHRKAVVEDKVFVLAENDSSGYITSPDISSASESENDDETATQKNPRKSKSNTSLSSKEARANSTDSKQRTTSTDVKHESKDVPVTLTRHHLKPLKDRFGGSVEARIKTLEKLQAIKEKMAENEPGPGRRKGSLWGQLKKRRARREKMDGDFTGSCMEKINYDEEEKPSLKRPEPKPEEQKPEKPVKEKRVRKEKERREREKKDRHRHEKRERSSDSKGKVNRFDAMNKKPKIKHRPRAPQPPPLSFEEIMKMAAQKQAEPVQVKAAPKKEKEVRPLTQEELDRKKQREERVKTKDYQDWYKYGDAAKKDSKQPEKAAEGQSGGFLRPNHNVSSSEAAAQPKSFAIPRKGDSGGARPDKASSGSSGPSVPAPKLHPTRPGMIANKPQAMAKHMMDSERSKASSHGDEKHKKPSVSREQEREPPSKSQPRDHDYPQTSGSGGASDRTKQGNAWDNLFQRPEYKKMAEPSAAKKRKMVIDSEDEDEDYDDEMDDFIDDEGVEEQGTVSSIIQNMFGYDRRKYRDEDDDDRNMEVGFSQVMKEEARSARLGRQEDLEDIRKEEEEKRRKALMKKKMRK